MAKKKKEEVKRKTQSKGASINRVEIDGDLYMLTLISTLDKNKEKQFNSYHIDFTIPFDASKYDFKRERILNHVYKLKDQIEVNEGDVLILLQPPLTFNNSMNVSSSYILVQLVIHIPTEPFNFKHSIVFHKPIAMKRTLEIREFIEENLFHYNN